LHTTFNLDFLKAPLGAAELRRTIDDTLTAFAQVGAPATWTLSNHDETRHVTRYGRAFTGVPLPPPYPFPETDLSLGTRRARAMLLVMLALPGSVFLYQGEELGLWEVEDLTDEVIADPVWESSRHTIRGRDGCRVPLPWCGEAAPFGFAPPGVTPWLPQPDGWAAHTAQRQADATDSMLAFYRDALGKRGTQLRGDRALCWVDSPADVLAFDRGDVRCVLNLSAEPVELPGQVIIASAGDSTSLSPDTAAWVRI
jgi:alpha-glucosidase